MSGPTQPPLIGWTVRELLARLRGLEGEALVVLEARNGGFVGVAAVESLGLKLFCNTHPDFGPHEAPLPNERPDRGAAVLRGNRATPP